MSTYVTIQGDTWDGIAYKALGSESYMHKLMELNFDHRMITVFPSGIELTLPDIDQNNDVVESSLPPWKRL